MPLFKDWVMLPTMWATPNTKTNTVSTLPKKAADKKRSTSDHPLMRQAGTAVKAPKPSTTNTAIQAKNPKRKGLTANPAGKDTAGRKRLSKMTASEPSFQKSPTCVVKVTDPMDGRTGWDDEEVWGEARGAACAGTAVPHLPQKAWPS
jgi:hypothetical protein